MLKHSNNYRYKTFSYKEDIPKPRKNEILIVPRDNRFMETAPYANETTIPKWWNSLPKTSRSMRRCQATYDYVSYGLTIPAWTDFTFRPNASKTAYEYRASTFSNGDSAFPIDIFPDESAEGCPLGNIKSIEKGEYIKLVGPWSYFTEPGTSLMILPALHSFNPNFIVMPGLVSTDFYHQVNIVLTILTDQKFEIKAGEPLAHIIPIKRNANFKKVIWGNESMYRFVAGNGLGNGCIAEEDNSQLYRKKQREQDQINKDKETKKWYNFFKK